MPVGDFDQWRQIFAEDFATDVQTGDFPGSAYNSQWDVYEDGWKDTAAKNEGTNSRYFPSRVISVSEGILNKRLHTENGTTMVAAIMPAVGDLTYGRFSVRFRADEVAGFKTAWLLWPQNEWPRDGEVDFPEAGLNEHINAYMHRTGATSGSDQDAYTSNARFNDWHTATIEWAPSDLKFILDGQVIGHSTSRVPDSPMHWVLQTETCMGGCQPPASAVANVQIDWVTVYARR